MDTIKKSELWQRIRAARKRAGLTQQDVAAALNIDRTAVTQWEARLSHRRTRPDINRLEAFAQLTRTPAWWLLSDEADVLSPWPEIVEGLENEEPVRPGPFVRAFWQKVQIRACETRPDLWYPDIWTPRAPDWMNPLLPDANTDRCILRWVEVQHVDVARIATLATSLLGFEQIKRKDFSRKAVLIWHPTGPDLSQAEQTYRYDVVRVREGAQMLCERLEVRYIEVASVDEAAHYLTQLL